MPTHEKNSTIQEIGFATMRVVGSLNPIELSPSNFDVLDGVSDSYGLILNPYNRQNAS
jgi:hypothetical protein